MNALAAVNPYLNTLDTLTHTGMTDGKTYVEPALRNLGTICIPVVREVVSPASFRNADPEITDIVVDGVRRVRAVANKFKFGERRRGLQILRYFKAGGAMAQNRTEFERKDPVSKGYDLNTLVFGDSANRGKYVLPVKACVQYSDAISLGPYSSCVDETFHNRASEDGSLLGCCQQGELGQFVRSSFRDARHAAPASSHLYGAHRSSRGVISSSAVHRARRSLWRPDLDLRRQRAQPCSRGLCRADGARGREPVCRRQPVR